MRRLLLALWLVCLPAAARADGLRLFWDAPTTTWGVVGYQLAWGTTPGVYTQTLAVVPTALTAEATGLTPGVRYYFVVRAVYANNQISANSNEITATVISPAPTIDRARVPPPE